MDLESPNEKIPVVGKSSPGTNLKSIFAAQKEKPLDPVVDKSPETNLKGIFAAQKERTLDPSVDKSPAAKKDQKTLVLKPVSKHTLKKKA